MSLIGPIPFQKYGDGACFARLAAISARLGIDLAGFGKSGAVIVGSNGKGSTAAMLSSLLQAPGAQVGRFTSPHLFRLNERFSINGADISDEALERHWLRVLGAVPPDGDALGAFEFLFLIAADWFAHEGCTATVWEAGIGGRFDPVRAIKARRVGLTSLDLEHMHLLGETLELIAYDKLDAAPAGGQAFISPSCLHLEDRLRAYCGLRDVTPVFVEAGGAEIAAPLAGAYQQDNAALAWAIARDMGVRDAGASARLAQTSWPGRLETISETPLVVLDVGHTPDAVRRAKAGFEAMCAGARGHRVLVCGVSTDKPAADIVSVLAPGFDVIIATSAPHKWRPAGEIAALAQAAAPTAAVSVCGDIVAAYARAFAQGEDAAIYVAGGLFIAIAFKAAHLGMDPGRLVFF